MLRFKTISSLTKWLTSTLVVAAFALKQQRRSPLFLSCYVLFLSLAGTFSVVGIDSFLIRHRAWCWCQQPGREEKKNGSETRAFHRIAREERGVLIMAQRSGADDELADRLGGISLEGLSGGDGKPSIGPAGLIHKVSKQASDVAFDLLVFKHTTSFFTRTSAPLPRSGSILTVATS